jgi:hypothetical protein
MSGIRKGFRGKKHGSPLLQAVAQMKWHKKTLPQKAQGEITASILSLTSSNYNFLSPAVKNNFRHRIFYNAQYPKIFQEYVVLGK